MKENYEIEIEELNDRIGKNTESHKAEITALIKEHDEMFVVMKKVFFC